MVDIQLMGSLNATLQAATLLFVAALGELITEKSGILNLGVEGMISVGAVAGFITAINTENLILSIFVGIISASIFSSIHAFVTVILKQDQTVSGLILTILGLALSALLGKNYVGKKLNVKIESIGNISEPTNVLEVLLNQNIIFYIAIVVMLTTAYVLKNTMFGRRFQAVGEDSKSSDSMGLNIVKTQFIATCVGGAFAGLDKIISLRDKGSSIGFEAEVKSLEDKKIGEWMKALEPEDLLKYGLIPVFIGRLPITATLEDLDERSLIQILKEPKNSLTKQYQELFKLEGVKLTFKESALKEISSKAIAKKTGARGLRSIIENILLKTMFELPSQDNIEEIIVDINAAKGISQPIVIHSKKTDKTTAA